MNEEGLTSQFLKRIAILDKVLDDSKTTRADFRKATDNLKKWLLGSRTLKLHHTFWKFITYMYESYGDNYLDVYHYYKGLMQAIGYCEVKKEKRLIKGFKCKFCQKELDYVYNTLIRFEIKSTSYERCTQKMLIKIFDKVKTFAMDKYELDFILWFDNLENQDKYVEQNEDVQSNG